jgi:hypothetical protein
MPKQKRQRNINFEFTKRDFEILKTINRCRYLNVSLIKKLIFSENKSLQSTQRRLKFLYHNQYLNRIKPVMPDNKGDGEYVYVLDQKGVDLLEANDMDLYFYSKNKPAKHQFINHVMDLAKFRINLEIALADNPIIELKRFTCDFEIKSFTKGLTGRWIYSLYDEVKHPWIEGRTYSVFPDALIILSGKAETEFVGFQRLYFVEIDRGTMGLKKIREKILAYYFYLKQGSFRKFGKFNDFKILLQTSSKKRAANIREMLLGQKGAAFVWVTDFQQVSEKSILSEAIWRDWEGKLRSVLKKGVVD